MNVEYVYLQIYRLFDEVTPIKTDCGVICGRRCCDGEDSGMYLFPCEEKVYDFLKPSWVKIEQSDFEYEYKGKKYNVPLAVCDGSCDRYQRPLACRIFPLTPYIEGGEIKIKTDPRAKSLCPLARRMSIDGYDKKFVGNLEKAFKLLGKNKRVYAFLEKYTEYLNEYERFF